MACIFRFLLHPGLDRCLIHCQHFTLQDLPGLGIGAKLQQVDAALHSMGQGIATEGNTCVLFEE